MISSVYKQTLCARCYIAVGSCPAHTRPTRPHTGTVGEIFISRLQRLRNHSRLDIADMPGTALSCKCWWQISGFTSRTTALCSAARAGRHPAPILIINGLSQNVHTPLALCAAICRCGDGLFTAWAAEKQVPRAVVVHTNLYLRSSS